MANRIEGVHKKILECAKKEFLECGYENASIRTIAKRADTSTNSIYVRFGGKENLYRELIEPIISDFTRMLEISLKEFGEQAREVQKETVKSYGEDEFVSLINYIYANFDIFKILITGGEFHIYQDFLHKIVELDVECTFKFMRETNNKAVEEGRISIGLAHILSVAFYSGLFELIVHDTPKEEVMDNVNRLRNFYQKGWADIFADKEIPL